MAYQLILVPAYGRKYDSVSTAKLDWLDGKDFRLANGSYCSIRDIKALQMTNNHIMIKITDGHFSEMIAV
jgi:hypothetical protein